MPVGAVDGQLPRVVGGAWCPLMQRRCGDEADAEARGRASPHTTAAAAAARPRSAALASGATSDAAGGCRMAEDDLLLLEEFVAGSRETVVRDVVAIAEAMFPLVALFGRRLVNLIGPFCSLGVAAALGSHKLTRWIYSKYASDFSITSFSRRAIGKLSFDLSCMVGNVDNSAYIAKQFSIGKLDAKPSVCCWAGQLETLKWLVKAFNCTPVDINTVSLCSGVGLTSMLYSPIKFLIVEHAFFRLAEMDI
ncbi:hypothetical protein Pelo_19033 [Pelomyxa schiedti]|nr:hypothetical protein Pelo_19033 [Pelomyxa schiedti]